MANILYRKQKQQKSLDNGVTWIDTGEYRVGTILENPSNCGSSDSKQCRWVELPESEGYYCDGYSKYTMQIEECTENGIIWTRTGNSQKGGKLIDSTSIECGYIPLERWVVSGEPKVCECGSVIYYEYKELYDDGVWTPTGEKRETEDFAITSGWSCYEESWDEGNDEYTLETLRIQSTKNKNSEFIGYCFYNDKIISLERESLYEREQPNGSTPLYGYATNLNVDGKIYQLEMHYNSIGEYQIYSEILFIINNKVYLKGVIDEYSIVTFNLNTEQIEGVIKKEYGYGGYCGYKISYNKIEEGNWVGNWIYDAETETDVQVAGNSGNEYMDTNLLGSGIYNYPTCDCRESSWANIGLLLGKGYRLNYYNPYYEGSSDKTEYKELLRCKWFKVTYNITSTTPDFLPQIIEEENTGLLLPTRKGGSHTNNNDISDLYKPMYKENNHRHVTSFVYKGNTLFYNENIYNINEKTLVSNDGFEEYYLTDNDNIVLGYRTYDSNGDMDNKNLYLLKIINSNINTTT